ncbi:hypothetical protein [Pantoea latae]|uniref:hypothetical protein n=1 Tax=Pantoea latae TaxID=1964541 RepID=UPI00117D29C0|nr:hypothetical protein [Pantoea latae]
MSAGTITVTNGSATVNGSGTSFTTEFKAGDFIGVIAGGTPYTLVVAAIASNTQLTIGAAYTGPTASGLAWNAVPASLMYAITQQAMNDMGTVLRGMNLQMKNWQQVYSGAGNVTVTLPDLTQFTGPSWSSLATGLSNAQTTANAALPKSGGSISGPIAFDNVTVQSATLSNLGLNYIANDRFSILTDGNRKFQIINATVVVTTNASGDATVTYPTAFTVAPRPVACSADWAAMNGNISTNNQNTTYFQVRCYKADGSIAANQSVRVDYTAVGRISS